MKAPALVLGAMLFAATLSTGVGALAAAVKTAPAKPPGKSAPAKAATAKPSSAKSPNRIAAGKPGAAKPARKPDRAAAPPAPAKDDDTGPQKFSYRSGVTAQRDLVYATLPGFRALTLDLYQPRRTPKDYPKPLLIFVHGGGWAGGDSRHGGGFDDFPALLASLAQQQDIMVASVNYRLSGEARFPAALQDVKSAIRWLRAHAEDYGIDITRVAIWGEEAGGQLAALAGTSCGVTALEPPKAGNPQDKEPSDCVEAVIDWHGIADLASLAADSGRSGAAPTPEGAYLGCEPAACAPGVVRAASPIAYIGPNSPPFLIQHGARKNVPPIQSQKLFDALTEGHVSVEQASYSDADTDVAKKSIDKLEEFLARVFPRTTPAKAATRPKSGPLPY